ncbi:GMC oxidoreductase [Roseobacteraceae bacterium S113]
MSEIDVAIIGAGLGGGTIGRALAEAGLRVLFIEKGKARHPNEVNQLQPDMFEPTGRLVRGLWPGPMQAQIDGRTSTFYAPIGAGLGGSSTFYAATLERPERHDIDDSADRPHPTGGWPLPYDALAPYFARAEALFRVCGAPDPLSPEPAPNLRTPPQLSDVDASFKASFEAAGLHPYALHAAIEYDSDGAPLRTLNGRTAGVDPALDTGRAQIMDRTEVHRVVPDAQGVSLHLSRASGHETLRARHVVMAGGAFGTPRLFLRSQLPDPSGLAGANLMFHLNEMLALWPRDNVSAAPSKALSLRDLYHQDGQRFGTVQAMGVDVGYGEIVHFLSGMAARSRFARLPGKGLAIRAAAASAARLFGQAKIFVGLLEDLPYSENRVRLTEDDTLAFDYRIHDELRTRRSAFRKAMTQAFKGHRKWFLSMQPELNFGHPCGTMRMGDDPARSVTNACGQLHGQSRLWVADASLFPTSMGVNPSLSIAALALHVGDHILKEMRP